MAAKKESIDLATLGKHKRLTVVHSRNLSEQPPALSWQYGYRPLYETLDHSKTVEKRSYETEQSKQFKTHAASHNSSSDSLEKMRNRRIFEIYGINSISNAAERNMLDKKYPQAKWKGIDKDINSRFNSNDYYFTPCRFTQFGWRFQPRDKKNEFLSHPNKVKNTEGLHSKTKLMGGDKANTVETSSSFGPGLTKTAYNMTYEKPNVLKKGLKMNKINASHVVTKLRQREYSHPPLPTSIAKINYFDNRLRALSIVNVKEVIRQKRESIE